MYVYLHTRRINDHRSYVTPGAQPATVVDHALIPVHFSLSCGSRALTREGLSPMNGSISALMRGEQAAVSIQDHDAAR